MVAAAPPDASVRVALRIRPPPAVAGDHPGSRAGRTCVSHIPESSQIVIGRDGDSAGAKRTFTFDLVFGGGAAQQDVYAAVAPLVDQFIEGYNATVLAYGQTSSGKTYTMGSSHLYSTTDEGKGIIPRVIEHLFLSLEQLDGKVDYVVRVAFLEIYQEQVRDLLMPNVDSKEIAIREDKNGVIVVSGLHEQTVTSAEEMLRCLEAGSIARTTGDTQMHLHSSRSHAIFTITLEQRMSEANLAGMDIEDDASNTYTRRQNYAILKCSKLHLVDLAGSERLKRTGAEGVRFKESVKINSGLLALGNVISILGADSRNSAGGTPSSHVPYRDSRLTRLLQDSLGGNSKTLMIACITPLEEDMEESLNTLKYANRARKIQNKPVVNTVDQKAAKFASMQQKIDQLEAQVRGIEASGVSAELNGNHDDDDQPREEAQSPEKRPRNGSNEDPSLQMLDLSGADNDEWMQYFIEELRNRTIRGTNAIKALSVVQKEKEATEERAVELERKLQETEERAAQTLSQLELVQGEIHPLRTHVSEVQDDLRTAVDAIVTFMKGTPMTPAQERDMLRVVEKHHGNVVGPSRRESAGDIDDGGTLPPVAQPSTNSGPPSGNAMARYQRRRSAKPSQSVDRSLEATLERQQGTIRRYEEELTEKNEALALCQDELEEARNKLVHDESIFEEKAEQVARLERVNTDLIFEIDALREHVMHLEGELHKDSTDIGVQTDNLRRRVHRREGLHKGTKAMVEDGYMTEDERENGRGVESEGETTEVEDHIENEEDDDYPVHVNTSSRDTQKINEDSSHADSQAARELSVANKARVELLRELAKTNKEYVSGTSLGLNNVHSINARVTDRRAEKTRQHHMEKVQKLERELEAVQRELVKVRDEAGEKDVAKEKMKDEYERKMKHLESQLSKSKTKQKEQEKIASAKEHSDRKIQELLHEVERLNAVVAGLKKKMKEGVCVYMHSFVPRGKAKRRNETHSSSYYTAIPDAEKVTDLDTRRIKELSSLKKQHEEDAKRLRQFEIQIENVRKKLDRKTEEVVGLKSKLRDAGVGGGVGARRGRRGSGNDTDLAASGKEEGPVAEVVVEEPTGAKDTAGVEPDSREAPSHGESASTDLVVSGSIDKRAIEIENFRRYHTLSKRHRELRRHLHALDRDISETHQVLEDTQPEHDESGYDQAVKRLEELTRQREEVGRECEVVKRDKAEAEALLNGYDGDIGKPRRSEKKELDKDTEDTTDWDDLAKEFADNPDALTLISGLKCTTLKEARHLVVQCLRELLALRHELTHNGQERVVEEEVKKVAKMYEKRMKSWREEYEKKLRELSHPPKLTPLDDAGTQTEGWDTLHTQPFQTLEKDLYYYRKTNKELKTKLREVVAVNQRLARVVKREAERRGGAEEEEDGGGMVDRGVGVSAGREIGVGS
ncbi:hypothetical protein HK104_010084 [Borealophlyctis nickersoniae]|nr:hypothetical protein HK104_010084 [Borealophlyctis nickersoniae]